MVMFQGVNSVLVGNTKYVRISPEEFEFVWVSPDFSERKVGKANELEVVNAIAEAIEMGNMVVFDGDIVVSRA